MAITSVLMMVCCVRPAAAEPPSTQSSPSTKTWNLPGLSGTADQIKVELHQELDHLSVRIAQAQGDVRSAQAEVQKHRDVVIAQLATANDPTYQYVCKTIADSQAELATTTSKSRANELRTKIDGFTKRRTAIEDQAAAANPDTQKLLAAVADKMATVNRLKADLAKGIDWRCEIGEAVRGDEMIQWPAEAGSTGIIGQIKITHIDSSGVVRAEGGVFKPTGQEPGQKEGIITVTGSLIPVTFFISGWNDGSIASGQEVFLDKMMRVVSSRPGNWGMILRLERFPCDDDAILDDFHEFRKPDEGNRAAR